MLKEFTKNTCAKYKRYEGIGKNDALNLLRNVLFLQAELPSRKMKKYKFARKNN